MAVPLGLAVCPYSVRSPLGAVRFNAGPARDRVGPGCRSSRGRGSQPRPVDRRGLAFVNEQICELTERIAERVREMWERTVPASSTIVALISIEVDERWRTLISIGSGRSLLSLQPRWSDHHTTPKTDWLPPPVTHRANPPGGGFASVFHLQRRGIPETHQAALRARRVPGPEGRPTGSDCGRAGARSRDETQACTGEHRQSPSPS